MKTSFMQAKETFKTKAFTAPKPVQQFGTPKGGKLPYGVGDRVRHIKFGEGTVTAIIEGGRDYEVTVHFDDPERRRCLPHLQDFRKYNNPESIRDTGEKSEK
mgnify:FL=1